MVATAAAAVLYVSATQSVSRQQQQLQDFEEVSSAVHTRIIINTGHLKMSLVVAGRTSSPKRLVVAVK